MSEWQTRWPEDRPRWGTYSVKGHTDLAMLIEDMLLYDVIVFPSPDTDDEYARWERQKWDPDLLALRVTQLGDHAVVCPWDGSLRGEWQNRMEHPPSVPEDAFNVTASVLADAPLRLLMGLDDARYEDALLTSPKVRASFGDHLGIARAQAEPLELVASFQRETDLAASTGARSIGESRAEFYGTGDDGVRLRFALQAPADANEDTLHRTLDLIEGDDFQHARRRLWSFEKELPAHLDSDQLADTLDVLVKDYNRAVTKQSRATKVAWALLIVPAAVGVGIGAATGGGVVGGVVGAGASVFFDRVKARFPRLEGDAARASYHPGSAAAGMLAIAGHVDGHGANR